MTIQNAEISISNACGYMMQEHTDSKCRQIIEVRILW
jgi:hypothetical protein